ncbi:contact-dependent growth inhibition system immunity protein [Allosphingosinicella sp.]|jgi:8-oxo-dGTP pyrophosphatase MutT (NUDIX family)|uniref:contact-dependent growth inhibition system immunity protein n=1 Tax=Allosphingosinicella sp. TaxID=2823234 RepID=UPI002EE1A593
MKGQGLRDEMEGRYPLLHQFFACYLNQDWPIESATPEAAFDLGIAGSSLQRRCEIRRELEALLSQFEGDDPRLRKALNDGLGINVGFRKPASARAFVEEAQRRLVRSIEAPVILIAAAVILDQRGRLLLVRKRGTAAFMLPGGKIWPGEKPVDALARELREELGCGVARCRPLGRFSAPAANEPGSVVEAELFAVGPAGQVAAAAEIDEALWHHPDDAPDFALAPLARDHVLPLIRTWKRDSL